MGSVVLLVCLQELVTRTYRVPDLFSPRQLILFFNPLTPNDLYRSRSLSPLKIEIPSKKSRQAVLRGGI
jgi:hypothetical protein